MSDERLPQEEDKSIQWKQLARQLPHSAPTGRRLSNANNFVFCATSRQLSRRWRSTSTDHAPTPGHLGDARARVRMSMSATVAGTEVVDGDTVVVVGASGGIGRLVIQRYRYR